VPFASRAQLFVTVLGGAIGAIAVARYEDALYAATPRSERAPVLHAAPEGPPELKRASAAELERVPGIGPRLAERIVAHRAAHGPFASHDALDAVPGVGPKLLAKLRGALRIAPQNSSNIHDTRARASLANEGAPSPK
jgi:competence ComEA-like helix-hairpin-helix protein